MSRNHETLNSQRRAASLPAILATGMLAVGISACGNGANDGVFTGYVEAEYIYVAAPSAGWLISDTLQEGDTVTEGDLLFVLDQDFENAARLEAENRLAEADALARDLDTGARDAEIKALEAQLHEAEATLQLAMSERKRWTDLAARGVASQARRDQVIAEENAAKARVDMLERNIETARLAGRDAAREAAAAARDAAAASLSQAEWRLDQRQVRSRTDGRIEEVFHRKGEYVPAGAVVAGLLPPDGLKVRFFAPQDWLSRLAPGDAVDIIADGAPDPVSGRISYIAREAEFTPPVIYSAETRDKLVFLIEARIADAAALRPGQPVDIHLR